MCVPAKEFRFKTEAVGKDVSYCKDDTLSHCCPLTSWKNDCCSACVEGEMCITTIDNPPTTPPVFECPKTAPGPNEQCVLHSTVDKLDCNYDKYCQSSATKPMPGRQLSIDENFEGCMYITTASCDGQWMVAQAMQDTSQYQSCYTVCGQSRKLLFSSEPEPQQATISEMCGC